MITLMVPYYATLIFPVCSNSDRCLKPISELPRFEKNPSFASFGFSNLQEVCAKTQILEICTL